MAGTRTSRTAAEPNPPAKIPVAKQAAATTSSTASKKRKAGADGKDELKVTQAVAKRLKATAEPKVKVAAVKPTAKPAATKGSEKRAADADDDSETESHNHVAKKVKRSATTSQTKAKLTASKAATKKTAPAKTAAKKGAGTASRATSVASKTGAQTAESDKENADAVKKAATRKAKAAGAVAKKSEEKDDDDDEDKPADDAKDATKQSNKSPAPKEPATKKAAVRRKTVSINQPPTSVFDVFVFGEGSNGELGLGNAKIDGKKPRDVKRPRLNTFLAADTVRVVQIACGGMHAAVLTADNKILTWGVNDMGALGRNTAWDGGLRDVDDDEDDDDNDYSGINPHESTPGEVDTSEVEPDTVFVQVVASDSATFALTAEGRVYGWGTFRNDEGILGYDKTTLVQKVPRLMPKPLEKVKQLAAGSNHILALDISGKVFTWGSGQHDQLGRKTIVKRGTANNQYTGEEGLTPAGIAALPGKRKRGDGKVVPQKIACGAYHSFIIDNQGRIYSWGLNNYGELGNTGDAGTDNASSPEVRLVESLLAYKIVDVDGGEHHSLACTEDGKLITWGRIDGYQTGLKEADFDEENAIFDDHKRPRILKKPTLVPDLPFISFVAGGTDHNFALTDDGKAYSWGFSANYQTGQGTDKDVQVPTLIDNTAVRGRKLVFAGAGGQYSILASIAEPPAVNGDT